MHPDWLGSPQHVLGGFGVALAVATLCIRASSLPRWVAAGLALGAAMTAEVAVEIVEYPLLYAGHVRATSYLDTIADLAATLAGAVLGLTATALPRSPDYPSARS